MVGGVDRHQGRAPLGIDLRGDRERGVARLGHRARVACQHIVGLGDPRSEEHTSELQSLMRISYAVFCLKKKKHITTEKTKSRHNRVSTHTTINVDSTKPQ